MQQKYADRGFVVLAIPCNQFGGQEPGTPGEIEKFVEKRCPSGLTLLEKMDVNGLNANPLFKWLKDERSRPITSEVTWNFEKFLIDRKGKPVGRWAPPESPSKFESDIVTQLNRE